MAEQEIGTVTHYFNRPKVAIVRITAGGIALGDMLHFHGHTIEFTEEVTSMEVDHETVKRAEAGEEVAIKVVGRARVHDKVSRVTE